MKEKRQEHKQKAGEARAANEKAPANRSSERSSNTTAATATATAQQQHHQQEQQQHHRELEQLPSQSLHALDKSGEKRWLLGTHTRI